MPSREHSRILAALRAGAAPRDQQSLADSRRTFESISRVCPVAEDIAVDPVVTAAVEEGADGETCGEAIVPAEWLIPPEVDDGRTLLFLHGGAYVLGSLATHRDLAARIARSARARALSLEYRLAPEHPFPAAVDDVRYAYRWLLAQGIRPEQTAFVGDSAGGGLALAGVLSAAEAGLPLPGAVAVLSPSVDLEGLGESMWSKAEEDPIIQRPYLLKTADAYLAGADPRHPLASPLHARLRDLPPMLIQVGTAETLLSDSLRFFEKARGAGVDVTLKVWEDMFHGWQLYARMLPEGQAAIEEVGAFLRQRLPAAAKKQALGK